MSRMYYSERMAYGRMPAAWRPVHRLLRWVYGPLSQFAVVRVVWRSYRSLWP